MKENGYNPMRWDCAKQGCFNLRRRPKIELFAECFKGNVGFGDVDGMVEVNSRLLILEWKSHPGDLPRGQAKMYERVTVGRLITVFCVCGNAETMVVTHLSKFDNGIFLPWQSCNFAGLKAEIYQFRVWAGYHQGIWPHV